MPVATRNSDTEPIAARPGRDVFQIVPDSPVRGVWWEVSHRNSPARSPLILAGHHDWPFTGNKVSMAAKLNTLSSSDCKRSEQSGGHRCGIVLLCTSAIPLPTRLRHRLPTRMCAMVSLPHISVLEIRASDMRARRRTVTSPRRVRSGLQTNFYGGTDKLTGVCRR